MTPEEELRLRIDAFLVHIDKISGEHYARNFSILTPPKHVANYVSKKWCRIETVENHGGRSAYGWVCLQDGETKALGQLHRGDIHKSASWKAPAKHARGSVFNTDFDRSATEYGIVYLK